MLDAGSIAPEFSLQDADGKTHSLNDFRGKIVVLYFYPKDDTPGCTQESCDFRDQYAEFAAQGAVVLGISPDDVASHRKFAAKHQLSFTLLADPERRAIEPYGVWKEKSMYGKKHMGVERSTFLIDPAGRVLDIQRKVKVDGHVEATLERVKALAS